MSTEDMRAPRPGMGDEPPGDWGGQSGLFSALRDFLYWAGAGALALIGLGAIAFLIAALAFPDPKGLLAAAGERVVFYDSAGGLLGHRGDRPPSPVRVAEIAPAAIEAILAIEDRDFYRHAGFDGRGLARAIVLRQPGATITQQLAELLLRTPRRPKIDAWRALYLTFWLESHYSKQAILGLYLARAPFGAEEGLEAGARLYLGKSADHLSLPEAVLLAGLLKAADRNGEISSVHVKARIETALYQMTRSGRISEDSWRAALETPLRLQPLAPGPAAGWAMDLGQRELTALAAAQPALQAAGRELEVTLTLDPQWQRAAETAYAAHASDSRTDPDLETAFIALAPDGAIKALIGGRDYRKNVYDYAVDEKRALGPAFLPFVYAAALEFGLRPLQIVPDQKITYPGGAPADPSAPDAGPPDQTPTNPDGLYEGDITLAAAFAENRKAAIAFVADQIGAETISRVARVLGLAPGGDNVFALESGAGRDTLARLSAAYAPFVNGGRAVRPHILDSVRFSDGGASALRLAAIGPALPFRPETFAGMRLLMAQIGRDGAGQAAAMPGRVVMVGAAPAGPTATDQFFVAAIGNVLAGLWAGRAGGAVLRAPGDDRLALIWRDFAQSLAPRDRAALAYAPPVLAPRAAPSAGPGEAEAGQNSAPPAAPVPAPVQTPAPTLAPIPAPTPNAWQSDIETFLAGAVRKKTPPKR